MVLMLPVRSTILAHVNDFPVRHSYYSKQKMFLGCSFPRTVVERLKGCELVLVLRHEVCEIVQELGTFRTRRVEPPSSGESFLGSAHGGIDVRRSRLGDLAKDLAIGCACQCRAP